MFKLNERLTYLRPDGVEFRLHAPPARVVMSTEGFGTPPLQYVVDRAPFQNGDSVRSLSLLPRPVQLVVMANFNSRREYWQGREDFIDALRPNRITDFTNPGKLLYYLPNKLKRVLDVTLDSGPGFTPPQGGWREWSFTEVLRFTAHEPAWYNPTKYSEVFADANNPTFPVEFPLTFTSFGGLLELPYDGTWLEYPAFTVVGPITNLDIRNNTTGTKLVLAYALPAGFSATITLRGTKSIIRSDGLNLLQYLTDDSDLVTFCLQPDPLAANGVNEIKITGADVDVNVTEVTMTWYNRYLGI